MYFQLWFQCVFDALMKTNVTLKFEIFNLKGKKMTLRYFWTQSYRKKELF